MHHVHSMSNALGVRLLDRQGRYSRPPRHRSEERFSAQDFLIAVAEGTATAAAIPEPVMPPAKRARRGRAAQVAYR